MSAPTPIAVPTTGTPVITNPETAGKVATPSVITPVSIPAIPVPG